MNFKREKIKELYLGDTHVENFFIAEYMVDAEGDFVKVFLTALMYADTDEMSNSLIARHLGITEEDVLRAWNYWEKCGVIKKIYPDLNDRFHYTVQFLNLKARLYGVSSDTPSVTEEQTAAVPEMDDNVLREVYASIEEITNRLIEAREAPAVAAWIYDEGVEPALISFAYRYCAEKHGQTRFAYVSAVLREWINSDIRTAAEAEKFLDDTDLRRNQYRRIMKSLGFPRNPTEAEQQKIDSWLDRMGFGMEKILEACSKTSGISSPNINYVDAILTSWADESQGKKTEKPSSSKAGKTASSAKNAVELVKKLYEETRRKNEKTRDERRNSVYRSIPEIEKIDSEIRKTSMDLSKALMRRDASGGASAGTLRKKIEHLEAEKAYYLTENGYPQDYLELQYECRICSDTGILNNGDRCTCFSEKLKQFV